MTAEEAVARVLTVLKELAVPHVLVGAFSSNLYGIPRSTKDADFVIEPQLGRIDEIARMLGPDFVRDKQIRFETVGGTYRHIFHVRDSAFIIEFFELGDDEHAQARFQRRLPSQVFGQPTFVPTAEDVVIMKVRWADHLSRSKDLDDLDAVIRMQIGKLDWAYIESWCGQHGTLDLVRELRRKVEGQ